MNKLNPKKLILAFVVATIGASGIYLIAADHIDAPAVTGSKSDITDFFAFQNPSNNSNMEAYATDTWAIALLLKTTR